MYSTDTTKWRFCPKWVYPKSSKSLDHDLVLEPMVSWGSISGHPYMIENEENLQFIVFDFNHQFQMILWVCFMRKKTVYPKFWPRTKKNMIGISQLWDDTERNLWLRHQRDANNQNRTRWRCHVFFIPNMKCFFPIDFCTCQGAAQTWSRVVFGGVQL